MLGAIGREGPKSSSSEEESFEFGGEEGRSESGAGGREGPRMRRVSAPLLSLQPSPPTASLEPLRPSSGTIGSDADGGGREGPRVRRLLGLSEVAQKEFEREREREGRRAEWISLNSSWLEAWTSASATRFLFASKCGGSSGPAVDILLFLSRSKKLFSVYQEGSTR